MPCFHRYAPLLSLESQSEPHITSTLRLSRNILQQGMQYDLGKSTCRMILRASPMLSGFKCELLGDNINICLHTSSILTKLFCSSLAYARTLACNASPLIKLSSIEFRRYTIISLNSWFSTARNGMFALIIHRTSRRFQPTAEKGWKTV